MKLSTALQRLNETSENLQEEKVKTKNLTRTVTNLNELAETDKQIIDDLSIKLDYVITNKEKDEALSDFKVDLDGVLKSFEELSNYSSEFICTSSDKIANKAFTNRMRVIHEKLKTIENKLL